MDLVDIIRMIAALLVTLGLVFAASWGMRRFGPEAMSRMQTMRKERRLSIVETLVLDPARRLVLVRLDGEERLIMLGEGRLLATQPAPPDIPTTPETHA